MAASNEVPLGRIVLSNVRWNTFERLLDEMGEVHHRMAYVHGKLEFMQTSFEHGSRTSWIRALIVFVALEMKIPIRSGGSTTLKQPARKVAIEPDDCYWIAHEHQLRGKKNWQAFKDPPPDLVVQLDIMKSELDRIGICAALKVPEVWRYDGEKLRVLILGAGGKYRERAKSAAFPLLPMDGIARFIAKVDGAEETALIQEFTAWLRSDVLAKKNGGAARKNGKRQS